MTDEEKQTLGGMLALMVDDGFSVDLFTLHKVGTDGPIYYCAIQSNVLRDSPEANSRCLKADTMIEAVRKAAKVAQWMLAQPLANE